jgi:hypothetical protein
MSEPQINEEQDDEPCCPACHSYWVTNTYDDDTDLILLFCRECGLMWKWAEDDLE